MLPYPAMAQGLPSKPETYALSSSAGLTLDAISALDAFAPQAAGRHPRAFRTELVQILVQP
jgi:hypothetical protein